MNKTVSEISPEAVLVSPALGHREKSKILRDWEQDEIALLRATDENMSAANGSGAAADLLQRIKIAEEALNDPLDKDTFKEVAAIFRSAGDLQCAMDDLVLSGFMPQELSILASEKTIEEKLGHIYRRVEEAVQDPDAPRTLFVADETMGEAVGAVISLPLYIAATTAAGAVVATGGTLLTAILATAAAGTTGAAIGSIMARMILRHHARYIEEQIDKGGLLLWVNLYSPEKEQDVMDVLERNNAFGLHVHEIPILKGELI